MDLSAITKQWTQLQSVLGDFPIEPRYAIPLAFLGIVILYGLIFRALNGFGKRSDAAKVMHWRGGQGNQHEQVNPMQMDRRRGVANSYFKPDEVTGVGGNAGRKGYYLLPKIFMENVSGKYMNYYICDMEREVDADVEINTDLFNALMDYGGHAHLKEKKYADGRINVTDNIGNSNSFVVKIKKANAGENYPDADSEGSGYVSTIRVSKEFRNKIDKFIEMKPIKLYINSEYSDHFVLNASFDIV